MSSGETTGQPNLHKQELSKLDVSTLTALTPEVISRQATINIGTIGHVAHGKSTVVKAISGVQTVRFKNELERNITIKLDKIEIDANSKISWPEHLAGTRVHVAPPPPPNGRKRKRDITRTSANVGKNSVYRASYEVERIVDVAYENRNNIRFRIKWRGYSSNLNTWEPLEHLVNCPKPLIDFFTETLDDGFLDELYKTCGVQRDLSNQALMALAPVSLEKLPEMLKVQVDLYKSAVKPPKNIYEKATKNARDLLILYNIMLRREEQLVKLAYWQNQINEVCPDEALIQVENSVDLEGPPEDFSYINEYVAVDNGPQPEEQNENGEFGNVGCDCEECGPSVKTCCGRQPRNGFTYNPRGRVNVNPGTPIYECNSRCACKPGCRNRVVQNGRRVPLSIYRTDNGCGWGVKALRKIYCGEFVSQYVGEVITHEEAEVRGKSYDAEGRTYLFDLDYSTRDNPYTVDAAKYGNVSHFINHSCDPNLAVYAVWVDCLDPNLPILALFAIRDVEKGEQLTFDYMMMPDTPGKEKIKMRTPDKTEQLAEDGKEGRSVCKCAADSCRRYLF